MEYINKTNLFILTIQILYFVYKKRVYKRNKYIFIVFNYIIMILYVCKQ